MGKQDGVDHDVCHNNPTVGDFARVYLIRASAPVYGTTCHVLKRITVANGSMPTDVEKEVDIMVNTRFPITTVLHIHFGSQRILKGHPNAVHFIDAERDALAKTAWGRNIRLSATSLEAPSNDFTVSLPRTVLSSLSSPRYISPAKGPSQLSPASSFYHLHLTHVDSLHSDSPPLPLENDMAPCNLRVAYVATGDKDGDSG